MDNILIIASTSELAQRTIEELKKRNCKIFATSRQKANIMDEDIKIFHLYVENELDFIHLKETFFNIKFDTIINFAGIAIASPVAELEENALKKQLEVNLFGLLRVIKYLCPNLKEGGKLVNVSSMASYGVFPFISPYCLSKAASDILLNSYAIENNVKVVSIRPGAVATKFWDTSIELNKNFIEDNNTKFNNEKEFLIKNAKYNSLHSINPIYVSKKIANIVMSKNPKCVYNIGLDSKFAKLSRFLPQKVINNLIKFTLKTRIKNETNV